MADKTPAPATGDDTPEPAKEPDSKPAEAQAVPEGANNPDAVKRALDAERKAAKDAAKRADAAEAKVREFEEANSSEIEKAQKAKTKAEQDAAQAKSQLLRYEVAQEKDVPAKLVPLLTATDKEGLEAQADLILENAAAAAPASPEFDGGARVPAPEPKSPEQSHNETLLQLAGLKPNT